MSPSTIFAAGAGRLHGERVVTEHLLDLNWNLVLVYPEGKNATEFVVVPHLKLPTGWHYGTALPVAHDDPANASVDFQPVSLYTLIDSPLIAGEYFRAVPLTVPARRAFMRLTSSATAKRPRHAAGDGHSVR